MFKRLKRMVAGLLVCASVVSSYVAWSGFTGREPIPIPSVLGGGPGTVTSNDAGFSDMKVRNGDGAFGGSIVIENGSDSFQDVYVTVDVFDGDQNVGELWGSVTLKPGTSSSVDLMSIDPYVAWSDVHVDLTRGT